MSYNSTTKDYAMLKTLHPCHNETRTYHQSTNDGCQETVTDTSSYWVMVRSKGFSGMGQILTKKLGASATASDREEKPNEPGRVLGSIGLTFTGNYDCSSLHTYGSPIFKVVQQKRCKALYTGLTESLKSLEYAVGEGSERSHVDRSVAVPP